MKHSDYIKLTGRLVKLTREADRTRALLTMSVEVMPDGAIVATSTPDQEHTPVDIDRAGIWRAVTDIDTDTVRIMDEAVDGWTDENQGRADRGLVPTADVLNLYSAMSGFLVATDTPAGRWGVLYERTRGRVRAWMDQAVAWFPDLAKMDQAGNTSTNDVVHDKPATPGPGKVVAVQVNRDRLAKWFENDFKTPKAGKTVSRFDGLYNAMTTARFTKTEWGRIAYAIHRDRKVVTMRVRVLSFSKWLDEFFAIIGVEVPKDRRPRVYSDEAKTRSFNNQWLRKQ